MEVTSIKRQREKLVFSAIHQQACCKSKISHPHNSDLRQTATGKTSFLSRTPDKHAAEARTAIRDSVTFTKRQLEKPISPVLQRQACEIPREHTMCSTEFLRNHDRKNQSFESYIQVLVRI